jgi:integration host factor subunit beta
MNKADLIHELSKKEDLTDKQARDIVNLIFDCFTENLMEGGRIEIRGFGVFSVRKYKAFTGRNPKTGKSVEVKPKKLPFFKVGKELRNRAYIIASI